MKTLFLISSILLLAGCASASLVQSVNEPTKGGVVKYKNSLLTGDASAEKANKIMANYCAPASYAVIQTQASTETVGYNASTNGSSYGSSFNSNTQVTPVNRQYTYVQFRCDPTRAAASTLNK